MTASYNLSQLGSHYNQGGTGAVDRTTASKLQESVSVLDFGADPTGVSDSTAAFTAALTASKTVFVPAGTYKLATPIQWQSGWQLIGEGSRRSMNGVSGQNAAILQPVTAAIVSATPTTQQVLATISGICFEGGTTQVDLGLFHEVTVTDCEFRGFTTAGLCLVRGEKNKLSHLRFDFTANSTYGLCFGYQASINYSGGLYAGQNPTTFFGTSDAWGDRTEMMSLTFQAGASTTWTTAAITSRILGGSTLKQFVFHGKGSGEGKLFENLVRIQQCAFDTHTIDSINTTGSSAIGYDLPQINNCTFLNIQGSYSGNSVFSAAFNVTLAYQTSFLCCSASGDNSTTYGFKFGGGVGQSVTLIGCSGAVYSAGANNLVKGQIREVGCAFSTSNLLSGAEQVIDINNQGISHLIMADTNGSSAATAQVAWNWATGSGQIGQPFRIGSDGPHLANGSRFRFDNAFGSGSPQDILVNSGTPEGSITAISGSLCLSYTGTTAGTLYVKQTGNGNTGWVAK